jgi:lipoate-protein ligase B
LRTRAFLKQSAIASMLELEQQSIDLGLVDFEYAWKLQKRLHAELKEGSQTYKLVLCQHHPVVTFGRQARPENCKASEEELRQQGISVYHIERGGDITYHGPGQCVVYPLVNLAYFKKDIHWFLRQLEEVVIRALGDWGIRGKRREGLTGVWVGCEKISSIGIAIKNWITFHGISINVAAHDLAGYGFIRPCGMDIQMTSMESQLRRPVVIDEVKSAFAREFQNWGRFFERRFSQI